MKLADVKLGVNCERKVKKLFLFLSKDYLYRNKKNYFFQHFIHNPPPICQLLAAGAKRCFHKNGMLRSEAVASGG
jgi:hypothetical protein